MKKVCIIGLTDYEYYGEKLVLKAFSGDDHVYAYDEDVQYVINKRECQNKVKYLYDFKLVPLCDIYIVSVTSDKLNDIIDILVRETSAPSGRTVVIESSVAVGKTKSICRKLINEGFHLCYSPRVHDETSFKIVSGFSEKGIEITKSVYDRWFKNVVVTKSVEVAEMTRTLIGLFRAANAAVINEFSIYCKSHGVDPFEVIDLASVVENKIYMPFTPWVGVGGDAGDDPFIISTASNTPVIKAISNHLIQRPLKLVETLPNNIDKNGDILFVGIGHKFYSSSWQSSPIVDFIECLGKTNVFYFDPYCGSGFTGAKWVEFADAVQKDWEAIIVCSPYMLSAWENHRCKNKVFFCQTKAFI